MTLSAIWIRFAAWLAQHTPGLEQELNEGALPYEVDEAETDLGLRFPAEFRESLCLHDGGETANGLIGNWDLFCLEDIQEVYWRMEADREDGNFGPNRAEGSTRVKNFWWHSAWIPIVGDTDGNLLCLDLDPGPQGTSGQVVLFLADEGHRRVMATGFKAWLEAVCIGLEEGRFPVRHDEDLGLYVFEKPGLIEPW